MTLTGTGTVTTQSATYALTVNGPLGCSQTNGTNMPIPNPGEASSTMFISGCPGNASAASTLAVNIVHTYTVNLSREVAAGWWRLEVRDWAYRDTGYINSWTLNL
ncbi:proprotein convertase P-domain-containing protein [Micromonospora sp. NPDC049460]|uniref:proprotein convertase P-domain-containing protein n=1 Tax=unclassified Micromonospora TaxID=2617518 RepID=UPI0037187853